MPMRRARWRGANSKFRPALHKAGPRTFRLAFARFNGAVMQSCGPASGEPEGLRCKAGLSGRFQHSTPSFDAAQEGPQSVRAQKPAARRHISPLSRRPRQCAPLSMSIRTLLIACATARSWLMNWQIRPWTCCKRCSTATISLCTERSSADAGASSTVSLGFRIRARWRSYRRCGE